MYFLWPIRADPMLLLISHASYQQEVHLSDLMLSFGLTRYQRKIVRLNLQVVVHYLCYVCNSDS